MSAQPVSRRVEDLLRKTAPLMLFLGQSEWARRQGDPDVCDFVAGNPHELPIPEIGEALRRWAIPQNKDWFAYKMSEPGARGTVAESLRRRVGIEVHPDDVFMTPGTFGALAVSLRTVLDAGDEVIFISPPWFFYEAMIELAGGSPVRVPSSPPAFDLPVDGIAEALTPRTRAVIVNSPNNPTGRVYPAGELERLAGVLAEASGRNGRALYLLSDESYRRILFDGREFVSPAAFYPPTFILYTYGKTLLTPGQRIGYIALPPTMPDRASLRGAIFLTQIAVGWAFPNALLQHALGDLEELSIDVAHLQRKRDRMVGALRDIGYELHVPEATFYLMPRSPMTDDGAFADLLAERDIFVLPGKMFEMPGYFRISLTANDDMIERSLPGFAAAMKQAREG